MTKTYTRATKVATSVLIFGVAASLAGNIQAIHLDNAKPGIGAIASAIVWPLVLFGVVELLLHTPWLASWRDRLTKGATVLAVGAVAAWVSYWHLANVLSHYGYDVASRYAGPVAVDMAMVLSALALNRVGQARRTQSAKTVDVSTDTLPDGTVVDIANGQIVGVGRTVDAEDMASGQANDYVLPSGDIVPLASWQDGLNRAVTDAGQELATEAEDWLAGLRDRVPSEPTLPVPVPVIPGPAPRERKPRAERQIDPDEAIRLVAVGLVEDHYNKGEIAELLAGWYGVSTRTIRRQGWWTAAMGRDASEGANAS